MFQVLNKTPFQLSVVPLIDQHGADIAAAALKATFKIPKHDEPAEPAEEQVLPLYGEEYFDTPENSGIKYPADLIIGKNNTDVGVNGCVYTKNRRPVEKMKASVRVGHLYKEIRVFGNRTWKKRVGMPGYRKSRPELFIEMPLTCDRIFGGTDVSKKGDTLCFESNPHGTGFIENKNNVMNARLPNFEDPKKIISAWKDKPQPATFGFANPASKHRVKYAGTYDEEWKKNHFPLYPSDLDLRFFNSAQPGLIANGFLKGGETVQLINLSESGLIEFNLPKLDVSLMFRLGTERIYKKGRLYTVVIEPELERFFMVWGASMSVRKQPARMRYVKAELGDDMEAVNVRKS